MRLESLESRRLLATFNVTTVTDLNSRDCDESFCSLRDAVTAANANPGPDTITFAPQLSGETLALTQVLTLTDSVSIVGLGADQLTLSGRGQKQVFQFEGDGTRNFVLQDMTLTNGRAFAGPGGAIRFDAVAGEGTSADSLLIENLVIRDSQAQSGGGLYASGGSLTVTNTSFVNNTATGGAAVLRVDGSGSITNSTFSGNSVSGTGAAVSIVSRNPGQTFEITSSSFVDNSARAIAVMADLVDATVSIQTSLFSNNRSGTLATSQTGDASARIVSRGNNLSSDSAGGRLNDATDRTNTPVQVSSLDRSTFTHAPLPGSPAIDSQALPGGEIPSVDQLGNPRTAGSGVDIGAVEVAFDFGDAPTSALTGFEQSYPTLAIDNGAYHRVGGPRLGATVDSERDGQPRGLSQGDQTFIDDEDGIVFFGGQYQTIGESLTLAVELQNAAATGNRIDAWVDWDRNGSWNDVGEQFIVSENLGTTDGSTIFEVPLPDDFTPGATHFRFRVSSAGGLAPGGMAADGEVEDYTLIFLPQNFAPIVDTLIDESDGDLTAGDVSLREAIQYANYVGGNQTIRFADALADQTIVLSLGALPIQRSMTIEGPTIGQLTIDANKQTRIFEVDSANVDLAITDLDLTRGCTEEGEDGGAILFESLGELRIERSTMSANRAGGTGGVIAISGGDLLLIDSLVQENAASADGGAIHADDGASVTIVRSSINDNVSDGSGGAVAVVDGPLTTVNSTIAGNEADGWGGGLYIRNSFSAGSGSEILGTTISGNHSTLGGGALINDGGLLAIDSSTVTDNETAGLGSGIVSRGNPAARTKLRSSIVAGNVGSDWDLSGSADSRINSFQSEGYNLLGSGNANAAAGGLDTIGVTDPGLAPLGFYGGANQVHPLLQASPALDAGIQSTRADRFDLDGDGDSNELLPLDARGVARRIDLQGIDNRADGVDVGAVEMIGLHLSDAIASETNGVIEFAIQLTNALPVGTTAELQASTRGGTAANGIDYHSLTNFPISLPSGGGPTSLLAVDLIDDALIELNEQFEFLLASDPSVVLTRNRATGTILSEDVAGILLNETRLVANESGQTQTLSIALAAQPLQDVVIELTLDRSDEVQLDRQSLTFTPENWNVPQDVIASAINDQRIDGDQTTQLTVAVDLDSDPDFSGLASQLVPIASIDDDVAGITIDADAALQTTEAGRSATFTIRLDALPTFDVTIDLSSSNLAEATLDRETIVFTPENGTTAQTITITGVDDLEIDGNVELKIVFAAAISVDSNFDQLTADDVTVFNLDDERLDYGDANDPDYPSLLANDGARHGASDLFLGTAIDFEPDALVAASTDGVADGDVDDGVRLATSLVASHDVDSLATLIVSSSASGRLDAWFDFNQDGDWDDPGEQVAVSTPLNGGDNFLPVIIPAGATTGETIARFRLSSNGGLAPTGQAADGEVEDYALDVVSAEQASVWVQPASGNAVVEVISGETVIRSEGVDLFRSLLTDGSSVQLVGSGGDNLYVAADTTSIGVSVVIDGSTGNDTIRLTSQSPSIDLRQGATQHRNMEVIDSSDDAAVIVRASAQGVIDLTDESNTLRLWLSTSDELRLEGAWTTTGAETIEGRFYQVIQRGDATLQISSGSGWTNRLNPLDVNASGLVTSLDALIIINELARRRFIDSESKLVDPTTLESFEGSYYDTNGDGRVTPIDALQVLNALTRAQTSLGGEQPVAWAYPWTTKKTSDRQGDGNTEPDPSAGSSENAGLR